LYVFYYSAHLTNCRGQLLSLTWERTKIRGIKIPLHLPFGKLRAGLLLRGDDVISWYVSSASKLFVLLYKRRIEVDYALFFLYL